MKKLFAILTLLIISISSTKALALGTIIDYKTDINIEKTSKINITETILYDFKNEQRHGIYRKIPFIKVNEKNEEYQMTISDVLVTDEKGNKYPFNLTETSNTLELKIGDPNSTITGKHTYKISYNVTGAITYFDTFDELYWNSIGTDWEETIQSTTTTITLPKEVPTSDIKSVCYIGTKGSTDKACTIETSDSTVKITTKNPLSSYNGVTIAINIPAGYLEIVEPTKVFTDQNPILTAIFDILFKVFLFFWYLVFPIIVASKWIKEQMFIKKNKQVVAAWFDPPKNIANVPFKPAEVAYLATNSLKPRLLVASIIGMAQRGYFKIRQEEKSTFGFKSTKFIFDTTGSNKDLKDLAPYEKYLYDNMFQASPSIYSDDLSKESFFSTYTTFNEMIDDELNKEGLIQKNKGKEKLSYVLKLMGLVMAGIISFNIPLGIATYLWTKNLGYTKKGVEKLSEAISLRNFLSSQKDQLNFQAINQMFFEKLLPYATAFGVENRWMEKFKNFKFEKTDWFEGDLLSNHGIYLLSKNITTNISSARALATASSSTSGFSSGFSGGSSGGGGGGGGGGSW